MRKEETTHIPLTQSQLSIWTGQRLHPNSPLHNVVFTFDVSGALSETIFKQAFQKLVHCTDALRLVFNEKNGTPYQYLLPKLDFNVDTIDFTSEKNTEQIQTWIEQRARQPIPYSSRIFDTALLKLNETRYIWFLTVHHLVTDAVSNILMYRRMLDIYQNLSAEGTSEIEEYPSFLEYLPYELEHQSSSGNAESRDYWKNKVAHRQLDLKPYGESGDGNTTAARRVSLNLGKRRQAQLRELAQRPEIRSWTQDLTHFTLFATLYAIYLHRVSRKNNLAIGAPSHNRGDRRFQKTIGLFIEVYPIFIDLEEDDTFYTVLQRVKLETNSLLRYAGPGGTTSEIGRSFNAILNYIQGDFPDFQGFPTQTEWVGTGHIDPSHAIRCHIYDFNATDELKITFDLNRAMFSESNAGLVAEHFTILFDAFLEDIHLPIGKPSMVALSGIEQLLPKIETEANPFFSMLGAFENNVAQRPNAIALQSGSEILTYAELNKRSNQLAHYLQNKGIESSSKVAVHLHRSSKYVVSVLSILKTGAAFIPMASDQPPNRIKYMCENSGCSLLLTEDSLAKQLNLATVPILKIAEVQSEIAIEDKSNLNTKILSDTLAYVLYTSGSTGQPKGVMVSHGALSNYLNWSGRAYHINKKSIFPLCTSIGFDLTLTSTFLPLLNGGRVVVYKEKNQGPDISLFQVIEDNAVNTIKLTPSHLALLNGRDLKSSHITTVIVGGENLKTGLAKSISAAFSGDIRIYNEYGPTEATIGCIVSEFEASESTGISVPIGTPIDNMQAFVLDGFKNLVPKGVIGELYISGAGLADGYVDDTKMTAAKFLNLSLVKKFQNVPHRGFGPNKCRGRF